MAENFLQSLQLMDFFGPLIPAVIFIIVMSFVPEPGRQRYNAIFVAGAGAVYLSSGGFGIWEFLFTFVSGLIAYKGLSNYRYIAFAWLMHTVWDLLHHFWGNAILPAIPNSSWGCALCDLVLAVWFWMGAPSIYSRRITAV